MTEAIFELAGKRSSCRSFLPDLVPDLALDKILKTALAAPSSGNLQAFEIVVVRDPLRRAELCAAAYMQRFVREAPVVLIFVANELRSRAKYGDRGELYAIQDATIAAAWAQLAAEAMGFGTCMVGGFDEVKVQAIIGKHTECATLPVVMVCIGVPAARNDPPARRLKDSAVHAEKLNEKRLEALDRLYRVFAVAQVSYSHDPSGKPVTLVSVIGGPKVALRGKFDEASARRVAAAEALRGA